MKGSKNASILRIIKIAVTFFAGFITACLLGVLFLYVNFYREAYNEKKIMQMRLFETDFKVLLEACRELSSRVSAGDLESGQYYIRIHPERQAEHFPKVILDLSPVYVYIDENDSGRVMLPMAAGLDHFGVTAYTEDYMESNPKQKYGDRELIPGLWYFDNVYDDDPESDNSGYDKKIEVLIQKAKNKKAH